MKATRLACILLLGAVSSAFAQGLADPTRPATAGGGTATGADAGQGTANGLQTIIRRHGRKPAAVINGEYVVLGGRVGDARLVKVGEDSVVLQRPAGKEEMKLLPGIEKKAAVAAKPKKAKSAPARNKDEATK
jgi:MSHA biogenesis protein MshK